MIKNKVLVLLPGPITGNMMDSGSTVNKKAWESTSTRRARRSLAGGPKERGLSG
jgi:hypothetical protein